MLYAEKQITAEQIHKLSVDKNQLNLQATRKNFANLLLP